MFNFLTYPLQYSCFILSGGIKWKFFFTDSFSLKFSASLNLTKYLQVPKDKDELAALQARLRNRFPVDAYNKARKELDPNRILSNNMLDPIFGNKWKSILRWLVSHFILSYPFYFWIHHMYCLLVNLLGASA